MTAVVPVLPPEIAAAAGRGWHILPVQTRGKLPLVNGWPEDATSDIARLEAWQHQYPACNWGLATGAASGLVVIDVDGAEGRASLANLERQGLSVSLSESDQLDPDRVYREFLRQWTSQENVN